MFVFHKPVGMLRFETFLLFLFVISHRFLSTHSSLGDPWGRLNLNSVLEKHRSALRGFHPVGRLDCDTSGEFVRCFLCFRWSMNCETSDLQCLNFVA